MDCKYVRLHNSGERPRHAVDFKNAVMPLSSERAVRSLSVVAFRAFDQAADSILCCLSDSMISGPNAGRQRRAAECGGL